MRIIEFRFWDETLQKMCFRKPAHNDFCHKDIIPLQNTGFKDRCAKEIYEGDILSDKVMTDEGVIESKCQVFWNEFTGSWHLDNSFDNDKSFSSDLWAELEECSYEVIGNIYENEI